jgi:long-chain acyl-CoA synthetase
MRRYDPETDTYNMGHDYDVTRDLPLGLKIKFRIADKLFAKVRALFGSNFKHSFSASASISPELLRFFYIIGIRVSEGYGSTESFNACANMPLRACRPGSVGLESNGSRLRVSEIGELELRGAGIFREYWNKPEETRSSFTEDGWFKTGDKVEVDRFGYYKIVDRIKAIICLSSGKNVAPAKIESLFATSPYIDQVFTIGDERAVISMLFVPNLTYFKDKFDREGIGYDKNAVVIDSSAGAPIVVKVGPDFIEKGNIQGARGFRADQTAYGALRTLYRAERHADPDAESEEKGGPRCVLRGDREDVFSALMRKVISCYTPERKGSSQKLLLGSPSLQSMKDITAFVTFVGRKTSWKRRASLRATPY